MSDEAPRTTKLEEGDEPRRPRPEDDVVPRRPRPEDDVVPRPDGPRRPRPEDDVVPRQDGPPCSDGAILDVRGLTKSYGKVIAVNEVFFRLSKDGFHGGGAEDGLAPDFEHHGHSKRTDLGERLVDDMAMNAGEHV